MMKKVSMNDATTSSWTDIGINVNKDDWFCILCDAIRLKNKIYHFLI